MRENAITRAPSQARRTEIDVDRTAGPSSVDAARGVGRLHEVRDVRRGQTDVLLPGVQVADASQMTAPPPWVAPFRLVVMSGWYSPALLLGTDGRCPPVAG